MAKMSRKRKAEYYKKYYEANKEDIAKRKKEYVVNNKDLSIISSNKRKAKDMKLAGTFTLTQWENTKQHFNNSCCYCGQELPLAQEHFINATSNGEYTVDNIVPSCIHCNSSKGDKNFFVWYKKYKYYSEERETKILKFLSYKNGIQQFKINYIESVLNKNIDI